MFFHFTKYFIFLTFFIDFSYCSKNAPAERFWKVPVPTLPPPVCLDATFSFQDMKEVFPSLEDFPSKNSDSVPELFTYHNYQSFTDDRGHDHIYAYGIPANLSEYCLFAQYAQYSQSKLLFEG